MPRWEYRIDPVPVEWRQLEGERVKLDFQYALRYWNDLASEGWELVSVLQVRKDTQAGPITEEVAVFKRRCDGGVS